MTSVFDAILLDPRLKQNPELLPKYAHPGDAGIDVRACIDAPITLTPGISKLVPIGFSVHMKDENVAAFLFPGIRIWLCFRRLNRLPSPWRKTGF